MEKMTRAEFLIWVTKTADSINRDKYRVITRDKYTIVINERNGKVGMARLCPDDEKIRDYGIALAYCRCTGKEFPKLTVHKRLCEMKNGEVFLWRGEKYRYIGKNRNKHVVDLMSKSEYLTWDDSLIQMEMVDVKMSE